MRAFALLLGLAACSCPVPEPVPLPEREIPEPCPAGAPQPPVPPLPRTLKTLEDYANALRRSLTATEDARTECARRINKLRE